jgi:hypothetical protein
MERTSYKIALTNSRGLSRAIFFSGLEKPMVIAPSLTDEPMLTAQLFYFLSRQECVAWVTFDRFEAEGAEQDGSLARRLETIVDNYLFALSRRNPEFQMTSKVHEYPFRPDMVDDLHFGFDCHLLECVAIDALNDKSIVRCEVEGEHGFTDGGFDDWLPLREIIDGIRSAYETAIRAALNTRIRVTTIDHEVLGTGTQALPIATLLERPLTFGEMDMFRVMKGSTPGPEPDRYFVSTGGGTPGIWIPKTTIEQSIEYDPQVLGYYFCALRDPSPIVQFKNYYNVLEFFFDAAGAPASRPAHQSEGESLRAVINDIVNRVDLASLFASQDREWARWVAADVVTSSGAVIRALDTNAANAVEALSNRIYAIRNACVHSKRSRKGRVEARFVPSLSEEIGIALEIPLIREIAARCIEKYGG